MPIPAIANPTSWGGQTSVGWLTASNASQLVSPATMAHSAPCVVARFQYSPANNGKNAATRVTFYVLTTSL